MEISRANYGCDQEEDAYPAVEGGASNHEHKGLAQGTDESQAISDEVKLGDLRGGQYEQIVGVCTKLTFVECGRSLLIFPTMACRSMYSQLRIA